MFCHKCGSQVADGAAFCHKCGAKILYEDAAQQPADTRAPDGELQQTGSAEPVVTEDTQHAPSNDTPKGNGGLRKAANIGRVLMWGSIALLLLLSFLNIPISPAIPAAGVAIGIILSAFGTRPLGFSKIIELVSAVILLVVIGVYVTSSGGASDKYIQVVKEGTLDGYPQMTVGEAFDSFLADPEWESGISDADERFVNVKGGITYYDEDAEILVQFIVDEENNLFQYNACEINGVPQNNLVFWNLLETIYGGNDPVSTELNPQNNSSVAPDKITMGETQSYNNEFGNIEVTIDDAEFVEYLTGDIYPDEECVFLRVFVTVKNVGTEAGMIPIGWNTLVYDDQYEFAQYWYAAEEDLSNIRPLSPPKQGTLTFMVPRIAAESDKSLVLNINDGSGKAIISCIIRDGNAGTGNDGLTPSNTDPTGFTDESNDLTYEGVSLTSWIGGPADTAYDTWGWPDYGTIVEESLYEGSDEFGYNVGPESRISFIIDYQTGMIGWITGAAEAVEFNGITLDKTRPELIAALGAPAEENDIYDEMEDISYYMMRYNLNGTVVDIVMEDSTSTAHIITISQANN